MPVRRFPAPSMWPSGALATCAPLTAMGRFSPFWDGASSELAGVDADEIHVHLLARDNAAANAVLGDLQAAFVETREAVSLAA